MNRLPITQHMTLHKVYQLPQTPHNISRTDAAQFHSAPIWTHLVLGKFSNETEDCGFSKLCQMVFTATKCNISHICLDAKYYYYYFSPSRPLAAPVMRPDSLPRLWCYINLLLTYLLTYFRIFSTHNHNTVGVANMAIVRINR